MASVDADKILKRAKKAFNETAQWHQTMRDAYKYAMPQRNEYDIVSPGAKKGHEVFDSTAIRGTRKFANRIVSGFFPAGRDWCKLEPGPLAPEEVEAQVGQFLEDATERMFGIIHNATNFQTAIGEWALDLVAGMGCMLINKGNEDEPVVYRAYPPVHIGVEEGADGRVSGVYRKDMQVKYRDIKETWPDAKLTGEIETMIRDEPDKACDGLVEACYWVYDDRTWYYEVIWKKSKDKIVERRYKNSPWIITRWSKASNEVAGRGPLLDALPDIKTINKLVELTLMNAALSVSGVYTGVDDGVLNPDTARISPGSIIAVARNQGHPSGPSLAPLDRAGDFDVGQLEHDRLSSSINGILMNNALPPEAGPVRTATEYIQRAKDLSEDLGAAFGRLVSEALVPIVQRTMDILIEQRIIQLPDGAESLRVSGGGVKLTVTGPLAQLQNLDDVDAIAKVFETSMALVGKDLTMLSLKAEEVPQEIAEKLGAPTSMIRSGVEKKQLAEAVASIMAAQQASGEGSMDLVAGVGQPQAPGGM